MIMDSEKELGECRAKMTTTATQIRKFKLQSALIFLGISSVGVAVMIYFLSLVPYVPWWFAFFGVAGALGQSILAFSRNPYRQFTIYERGLVIEKGKQTTEIAFEEIESVSAKERVLVINSLYADLTLSKINCTV